MCHSDEDEELWNTDPQEYIRIKYGTHNVPTMAFNKGFDALLFKKALKKILCKKDMMYSNARLSFDT